MKQGFAFGAGIVSAWLGLTPAAFAETSPIARWAHETPLPVGVAEVGVAELDGRIYVVGGTEQHGQNPPVWSSKLNLRYDPVSKTWRRQASIPQPLSHVGLAALNGKLYAIGGFTDAIHMGAQSLALVYDPKTDTWSPIADLALARGSVAAVAVDGKLHIFGGRHPYKVVKVTPPGAPEMFAAFGTVNLHGIYDPATGKWSLGSSLPGPARDHMGVAVLDGKVHLFGGRVADVADNLTRHDVYDPRSGRWSEAAPLPSARSSGAYTVLDGRIIYAGGECKPGGAPFTPNVYDDVTAYDPKTNSWSALPALPSPRHAFGAATVKNVAYFVGGASLCGGGTSTDLLSLTLR